MLSAIQIQLENEKHIKNPSTGKYRFADAFYEKHGTRLVWCGDELYLKAGLKLPPDEYYEEYSQLENGVGMIRLLLTEFREALQELCENKQEIIIKNLQYRVYLSR